MNIELEPLLYCAADAEGMIKCHCGSKYWTDVLTPNVPRRVECASCGEDLNKTLPGVDAGVTYATLSSDAGGEIVVEAPSDLAREGVTEALAYQN